MKNKIRGSKRQDKKRSITTKIIKHYRSTMDKYGLSYDVDDVKYLLQLERKKDN